MLTDWPHHRAETYPWLSRGRQGNRADRTLTSVTTSIPPLIAHRNFIPTDALARAQEDAVIAIARLEGTFGDQLAALTDLLIRSESVASSKIENINADWQAFGKAFAGGKASPAAKSQLAATHALTSMVNSAKENPITVTNLLETHRLLMAPDFYDAQSSGMFREVQNWIGGSDYTPINAMYVPPPPHLVPELIDDLLVFANRTDLPIITQAAIVHAQFESIHPFIDGNGRIGRTLISGILRRRKLTRAVTVPLAAAMLASTNRYFDCLTSYRLGSAGEFIEYTALAATHAATAAYESALTLSTLPQKWHKTVNPRTNSADAALLDSFLDYPIFNADTAQRLTKTTAASTYKALERLTEVGILSIISENKRNRIWAVQDILDELDTLSRSIEKRITNSEI